MPQYIPVTDIWMFTVNKHVNEMKIPLVKWISPSVYGNIKIKWQLPVGMATDIVTVKVTWCPSEIRLSPFFFFFFDFAPKVTSPLPRLLLLFGRVSELLGRLVPPGDFLPPEPDRECLDSDRYSSAPSPSLSDSALDPALGDLCFSASSASAFIFASPSESEVVFSVLFGEPSWLPEFSCFVSFWASELDVRLSPSLPFTLSVDIALLDSFSET